MSWNMENESIFLKFELFSQREGLKPLKQTIQIDSVDEDLKNGFKMYRLGELLWINYFKQPLDTLSNDPRKIYKYIRDYFFDSKREWNEIYDFIEFVVNVYPNVCPDKDKKEFIKGL
jgi:hypothetical protein